MLMSIYYAAGSVPGTKTAAMNKMVKDDIEEVMETER